ncbi:MAG: hypothetical protein EHM72_15525 [Calditrichaeota bacterium]|nr:MAG: hypothetical protein EHM72_15525 [Calditrichota bacterium]
MGVYRHLFAFTIFEHLWKPALCVLLMCLFLLFIKGLYLPLIAFLAALLYGFFLVISRAITTSELKMVKLLKTA